MIYILSIVLEKLPLTGDLSKSEIRWTRVWSEIELRWTKLMKNSSANSKRKPRRRTRCLINCSPTRQGRKIVLFSHTRNESYIFYLLLCSLYLPTRILARHRHATGATWRGSGRKTGSFSQSEQITKRSGSLEKQVRNWRYTANRGARGG